MSWLSKVFKKKEVPLSRLNLDNGVNIEQSKPLVLVIIDGYGVPQDGSESPWRNAAKPNFEEIEKHYPFTTLQASGIAVGLPWGEAGNSEVGHLTIGAGKVIYNYLPKISTTIKDGSFYENKAFMKAVSQTKAGDGALHFLGLFSSGTVHAYFEHLYALLELAKRNGVDNKTYLHLFTDGKDAYEREGADFYDKLEDDLKKDFPNIKIASIMGRSFAMNRNEEWGKTEKAYNLLIKGEGENFSSVKSYIENNYAEGITDSAIAPAAVIDREGRIKSGDSAIFFNFREDSARQLTEAFIKPDFDKFNREKLNDLTFVTMTEYDKNLPTLAAFKSAEVANPLAKLVSESGLSQLHIAETEKYAHITFFLNGGRETPFKGEDRLLVPSPNIHPYSQAPAMSSSEIAKRIISNLGNYDFIAANFANADMVGHTGDFDATTKAIETIDSRIGELKKAVLDIGGTLIGTADHGNAEEKLYKSTGNKKSEHSLNPVPFYVIGNDFKKETAKTPEEISANYRKTKGALIDVAPTVLSLLKIQTPAEMTGRSLLEKLF